MIMTDNDDAQTSYSGIIIGNFLCGLVEFKSAAAIRRLYSVGVRDLQDGGVYGTLAGQPTDVSDNADFTDCKLLRE
jgi:ADP-ribosyl-[dinitrogen reductase] hydrolase